MVFPPPPRYRLPTESDNRTTYLGNAEAVWRVGRAMRVPLRTFALFGLALAMLAAGYWFAPAPGAASLPTPTAKAARPSEPDAKPDATAAARPAPRLHAQGGRSRRAGAAAGGPLDPAGDQFPHATGGREAVVGRQV